MEEDIKILEEKIKEWEPYKNIDFPTETGKLIQKENQAIENLIKGYRELEKHIAFYEKHGSYKARIIELQEENESKEKAYNDCYCEFKHYKQYESIPKSKVEGKIEELNKNELLCKMNFENIKFTIEVLQELLGDE